jgi:hypothetical protein
MNKFHANILLASTLIAGAVHAQKITIDTGINAFQLLRDLSLDDKLTILYVGKFKALVSRQEIAERLQKFEALLDVMYRNAQTEALAHGKTVDELVFKQKIVLALYAALYKMAEQEIADEGSEEQEIIFTQQLTPEQIIELFAEE